MRSDRFWMNFTSKWNFRQCRKFAHPLNRIDIHALTISLVCAKSSLLLPIFYSFSLSNKRRFFRLKLVARFRWKFLILNIFLWRLLLIKSFLTITLNKLQITYDKKSNLEWIYGVNKFARSRGKLLIINIRK